MVSPTILRTLTQSLNFALVLSTAFMLWKSLSVLSDSHSPIVVVLSGSMEPAFQRGDLLFLWNRNSLFPESIPCVFGIGGVEKCGDAGGTSGDGSEGAASGATLMRDAAGKMGVKKGEVGLRKAGERKDARLGEIVVYEVRGKDIPIVHRVVRRFGGGYVWLFPFPFPFTLCFRCCWFKHATDHSLSSSSSSHIIRPSSLYTPFFQYPNQHSPTAPQIPQNITTTEEPQD